jgi:hypothetical protein
LASGQSLRELIWWWENDRRVIETMTDMFHPGKKK